MVLYMVTGSLEKMDLKRKLQLMALDSLNDSTKKRRNTPDSIRWGVHANWLFAC